MKRRILVLFAVVAFALSASAAVAAEWQFDATHTSLGFKVKHLALASVSGVFEDFTGTLDWDGKMDAGKVTLTIDAASINTRNEKRDQDLRENFFDVAKYPKITFESTKVQKVSDDTAKVTGNLTIRGVTKPVTLDVTKLGYVEKDPWGMTRAAFHVEGSISRKDFGVKSGNAMSDAAVGDEIKFDIDTETTKK
ncbi:YceI family protein [bacterium]|nr:YceI family protein [bacterium]